MWLTCDDAVVVPGVVACPPEPASGSRASLITVDTMRSRGQAWTRAHLCPLPRQFFERLIGGKPRHLRAAVPVRREGAALPWCGGGPRKVSSSAPAVFRELPRLPTASGQGGVSLDVATLALHDSFCCVGHSPEE